MFAIRFLLLCALSWPLLCWASYTPSTQWDSESADYFQAVEQKLLDAKEYIARQRSQHPLQKLALILDIDDTCLSTFPDRARLAFTPNPTAQAAAMMLGQQPPIVPILDLYQYALTHQISVFFISERPDTPEVVFTTAQNLKNAGFMQWERLILQPLDKIHFPVATFKTLSRKQIIEEGFEIILNIGDSPSDLEGGYAAARIKIPTLPT